MQIYPKTIIIRHRRENLKKCSLRGLEKKPDFQFIRYPFKALPNLDQHVMLVMDDAEELTATDQDQGIILLDSLWRYLPKMIKAVEKQAVIKKRKLPVGFKTAYPRRQEDCEDPGRGLASAEALFIAMHILKRPLNEALDHYTWKESFLKLNDLTLSHF